MEKNDSPKPRKSTEQLIQDTILELYSLAGKPGYFDISIKTLEISYDEKDELYTTYRAEISVHDDDTTSIESVTKYVELYRDRELVVNSVLEGQVR